MNKPINHIRRDILADFDRDHANLEKSFKQADSELLKHLLDVQHLATDCFTAFLAGEETDKRISASGIYEIEMIHLVERACMQTLCWYYGVGTSMLRSALEARIRGAFWEGMAHKKFRDQAQAIRRAQGIKINEETRRLHDWFADVFKQAPNAEAEMDLVSGGVFDRVSPLFSDPVLSPVVPRLKTMVEQIAQWGLLAPIPEPSASIIYGGVYWQLSDDAHLIPDKTLLGRRFAGGKPAFPTVEFSAGDLKAFMEMLEIVADIGIVLSLNLVARVLPDAKFAERQFQALAPRMREILPHGYCGDWKPV